MGAPDPQTGTLSPGWVGGFCRPRKVPTFDENRSVKFLTVFEIFEVKVFPFSPHNVTTEEVSAPQQCHMVGVVGGYNVLYGRDPSLLVAPVRDARSFGRIGPREKCVDRLLYTRAPKSQKEKRRSREKNSFTLCVVGVDAGNAVTPSTGPHLQVLWLRVKNCPLGRYYSRKSV